MRWISRLFPGHHSAHHGERTLKESQQSLSHAQSIAHIGNWDWDMVTNELKWTDEIYRIFGLEPQQFEATYEAFVDRIHPDDRDKVNDMVLRAVERKEDYFIEHRVVRPNGEERIVTERGEVLHDKSGKPIRMVGVVQDITENRVAERARMESEERLNSFMNSATDIFTLYDAELNLIEINQAGLEMFGVSREQIIGRNMSDLQVGVEVDSHINELRKVIETGEPYQHEESLEYPTHGRRHVQIKAFKAGSGMGMISSDITESKRQQAELVNTNEILENMFATTHYSVALLDKDYNFIRVNQAYAKACGFPADYFKGKNHFEMYPSDELVELFGNVVKSEKPFTVYARPFEFPDMPERGTTYWDSTVLPVKGSTGKVESLLFTLVEVTGHVKAKEQLYLASKVFENSLDAIMVVNKERKISSVNQAFCDITGFTEVKAVGSDVDIIAASVRSQEQVKCVKSAFDAVKEDGNYKGEIWCMGSNGKEFPVWININSIQGEYGAEEQYVAIFHDITEAKEKEREIEYQAYYDALTGLPNRLLLQDRLKMAVARAKRENEVLALMFLDLDNFKNVNDSLGHDVGDLLLKGVSVRLVEALREIDTVARIGGDEFVILLESLKDQSEALRVARKVIKSLNQSFKFRDKPLYATGSMGITLFPEDGMDTDTLLKNADMAMYKAKEMGKGGFQMFTADMNEKFASRLTMENNLREAMDKDQFVVYYQPKMDISSGDITGMEALVRWIRPDGTITSPGDFIPVAEETGMILRIGETVLRKSLQHLARMNKKMGARLKLSVNLSARQFAQENVVEMVTLTLKNTGVEPSLLELEITESSVMADVERAMLKMRQIKKLGVRLSIDDFGTGFSSLNYLRKFPIDVLKIDRSFVKGMKRENADTAIVDSIITIAKNLGLKVVAEGVETKNQLNMLRGLGCDEIQGYLVSRPIAEDKIMEVIGNLSRYRAIA
ncbi:MAG: EAL domain-containing protein [Nitrospinota bacterium]|nr:EAL domain-containing protein [Nitrospinota bacterium]